MRRNAVRQIQYFRSTPARLVLRAKIVLAAAEGRENKDIAAELGCTRRTVGEWRI
ncbi:MAG: helix-turn-helix domain-containing protein, partial [Planctomycetaceae bacterium]|nr:helix-turn-helix domain-containing protein [Planctomycetaceae bacterium]